MTRLHEPPSLRQALRWTLDLLPPSERRRIGGVLFIAVAATVFETAGVASILPFMSIVVDPDALTRYPSLATFAGAVGAGTWRQTVIWAAVATGTMVALGNLVRLWSSWLQWRLDAHTRHRLASQLMRAYLQAPYAFHVARDASSLIKVVGHDAATVTGNIVVPILTLVSRGLMVLALVALLALQSPAVAATACVTLGGAYYLVFRLTRRRQSRLGELAGRASYEWQRTSLEALGGIKELTVMERRASADVRFAAADLQLVSIGVTRRLTEAAPRHLLEALTFGCILLVTVALVIQGDAGSATAIPTLALYAFIGYRLMPGLQQLYSSAIALRYGLPALRALHADWMATSADRVRERPPVDPAPLPFTGALALRHVTFTYPAATRPSLTGVTLTIHRGESIGLVGRTGAGKTTLADVLLGLFEPQEGTITVDGAPLTAANIAAWRRQVGYVAQHIFLANATVAENIGFGLAAGDLDMDAVRDAARLAQVDTFIETLPKGYDTVIGERGVRLSGGERQRLGIARALYRRPSVLIFDEATSALDGLTEDAVMDAIRHLSGERTVVLIAHRLRTLDACDRLVLLDAGAVVAVGPPAELASSSPAFARFVGRA